MQKDDSNSVRKEDVPSSNTGRNTENSSNHHVGEGKAKFEILPPPRPSAGYVEFIEGGSSPNDVARTSSENKESGEAKDDPPDDHIIVNASASSAITPGAVSVPGIRGNQRDARSASENTSEEERIEFPPLFATVVTDPIAVTAEPIMPQTQNQHIPDEENAINNAPPAAVSTKRKFQITFGLMFLFIIGMAIGLGVSLSRTRDDKTNEIGKFPQPPSSSQPSQPSNTSSSSPPTLPTRAPTFDPSYQPSNKPSSSPPTFLIDKPTRKPTNIPTLSPSTRPTHKPTPVPNNKPTPSPSTYPTHKPTPVPTDKPTIKTCPCKQVTIIAIQTDTEGWGEGDEVEVKLYIDNAVVWPNSGFGDLPHGTFGKNQWLSINYANNIEKSTGSLLLKVEDHDDLGSNDFDSVIVPESNWHENRCDTYEKEYMTDARNWRFRIQVKAC